MLSPLPSTRARARHSDGRRQQRHSTSFYCLAKQTALRRLLEPKQYTSRDFAQLARDNGVQLSVGMRGDCWDNAVAESFFATIKRELVETRPWPTRAGLARAVFNYIEGWYNTRRRHSSLGYKSPAAYEALNLKTISQAA